MKTQDDKWEISALLKPKSWVWRYICIQVTKEPVTSSCEHGDEHSVSVKDWNFIDKLQN